MAHGNRGRRPHNAVLDSEAAAVVQLARAEYAGTNHTHLTELLRERDVVVQRKCPPKCSGKMSVGMVLSY